MKNSVFLFFLLPIACKHSQQNNINYPKNPITQNQRKTNNSGSKIDCNFQPFIEAPGTPQIAKQLYFNTYILKNDEPLALLSKLSSLDDAERMFYFRVITNSYAIADGSYAEGLGAEGTAFIEKNTLVFARYLALNCFTIKDMETWADIAMLELEIDGAIDDEGNMDKNTAADFCKKLTENCKKASTEQQQTIATFNEIVIKKYNMLSL